METLQEIKKQETEVFRRSGGMPTEFDGDLNDITRNKIYTFANENGGECCLGRVNLYSDNTILKMWSKDFMIYNFDYTFAIPKHDTQLETMIRERSNTPYTGTKNDYVLVNAIMGRIEELRGINLFWV